MNDDFVWYETFPINQMIDEFDWSKRKTNWKISKESLFSNFYWNVDFLLWSNRIEFETKSEIFDNSLRHLQIDIHLFHWRFCMSVCWFIIKHRHSIDIQTEWVCDVFEKTTCWYLCEVSFSVVYRLVKQKQITINLFSFFLVKSTEMASASSAAASSHFATTCDDRSLPKFGQYRSRVKILSSAKKIFV